MALALFASVLSAMALMVVSMMLFGFIVGVILHFIGYATLEDCQPFIKTVMVFVFIGSACGVYDYYGGPVAAISVSVLLFFNLMMYNGQL